MITPDVQTTRLAVPVGPHDHMQGPKMAPLTLVEYGDYECPYSARAHLAVRAVQHRLGKQLRFVYRNFPLRTIHPHAELAAEVAEAAARDGEDRFWEMHDTLYENQHALEPHDLIHYAIAIGLDPDRVTNELRQHVHEPRISAEFSGGVRSGVHSTPTFFINDELYEGRYDQATLTEALLRAR